MLRVFGPVGDSDKEFELIIPDDMLRKAMLIYSRNVALLSLLISLFTATAVFYAINRIMIRPIRDMTRSMLDFSQAPDDPARVIVAEDRADEIGVAERELAGMQQRLQKTLGEQKHLADLGLAVSKINHDMRNILASAQLMSDRLGLVKDPTVQALVPKLVRALESRRLLFGRRSHLWPHPGGAAVSPAPAAAPDGGGRAGASRHRAGRQRRVRQCGRPGFRDRRRFGAAGARAHQSVPQLACRPWPPTAKAPSSSG